MKRSTQIVLLAMGGAGAVVLYAHYERANSTREAHVYRTINDCVLSGPGAGVDAARCRLEYDTAMGEHLRTAPRYQTASECEADYGANACEYRTLDEGSFYVPKPIGYMFGDADAARSFVTQPLYPITVAQREEACQADNPGDCPPAPETPQAIVGKPTGPNFICDPFARQAMGWAPCPTPSPPTDTTPTTSTPSTTSSTNSTSTSTTYTHFWYSTGHGTIISTPSGPSATTHTVSVPRMVASAPPSRVNVVARSGFGQTGRSFAFHSSGS